MELIVTVALLALFGAWWIARGKTGRSGKQITFQQATPELSSTAPKLPIEGQFETRSPPDIVASTERKGFSPFAEIADPNGGVRGISAEEVSAYFRPVETKLASLRKVAANSTRVAKAFERSGGLTPSVDMYRRAHADAIALTAQTEALLDIMLFGSEADSNRYDELLERVVDVEMELEENLASIAKGESAMPPERV
ncbi:MAG TPA: hypothetical protein VGB81_04070 [Devosia sp.]|jgi:hypothetical protein